MPAGGLAHLGGPAHECIATQRHACSNQGSPGVLRGETSEDPVDLFKITRVVGAWRVVEFARTAPEVRHGEGQAMGGRKVGEGHRVLAGRRAFETVEQHQQGRIGRRGLLRQVHVDEVAIGCVPAAARPHGGRAEVPAAGQRSPQGLRVATGQPPRSGVVKAVGVQCRTGLAVSTSGGSVRMPGLAWCATMRQPCAVLA